MPTLIDPYQDWRCPACKKTDRTRPLAPNASRMHPCPKMGSLVIPMVRAGIKAKITAHLREDHVGSERVTLDDHGRPVMSVTVTRDHGMDTQVFAPLASSRVQT